MLGARWLSWALILAAGVSWASGRIADPTAAGAAGSFFAGRTITYIVCTGPGGGYDTYARLVARHLERHLQGARVVVRNVPGAAHLLGLDQLYAAPPDGLTIGTFTASLVFLELTGSTKRPFDFGRMSWIGKAAAEPRVLAVGARTPFRTLEDVRQTTGTISIATEGAQTSTDVTARLIARALGLRVQLIPGFSEDEGQLAVLRGDVTAVLASPTSLQALVEGKHARSVLRLGGTLQFDDGVPTLDDLDLTSDDRAFLELLALQGQLGRITAGPPGIPQERLAALRRAYTATMHDPAFLAEAARRGLPIDSADGERLEAGVRTILNPPRHVGEWLRQPTDR